MENNLITPEPIAIGEDERESYENWGFADTAFAVNERGNVTILGTRYELSGKELPRLLPWIREVLNVNVDTSDVFKSSYPTAVPAPVRNEDFLDHITKTITADRISFDDEIRLRHGHGHTQEEMFAIKYGRIGRIPDFVVYPISEDEVAELVTAADANNVVLIPFGGGTNVTDALRCREDESRMVVSVDMRRMNRIRWIDKENMMACIEAGAVGRHIMQGLARYGVTMGHEPDSVEFSTLGGWIATNASGMKKNKYGNIEDIVLDVTVVGSEGKLERRKPSPRESTGIDLRRLLFGSEGTLGIVTSAIVKLFPLPEVQEYGSVIFPNYESGFAFMRDLVRESTPPASCRLVDNLQFQFGQALKPASESSLDALKGKAQKFFVTKVKGFDPYKMVALTLVFEGTRHEVDGQKRDVYRIAKRHGGMKAGSENGRRGYQLTYSIAYIRDFLMNYHIIAESFETSCSWSDALPICVNVKKRLLDEYAKRGLPGRPFVTSRITQLYKTGVAIYFYFGFYFKGVDDPSHVYLELENIAREEILANGGSLSHHHGVGKIREQYLPEIMSEAMLKWKGDVKRALDPNNIFGVGNQKLGRGC
ncbi:FAD-binding oxidoreductase [Leptolyngbya sp. 7M]|uniref:FAD-binding oxidoreductase n=1 Tax=Leptolyngbya sp. 7M TaxID=2812896 RepID=UPI001B8B3023|nr:FAD-binding oxidoreductase [Leptolyngbya sp. 7M]QYO66432.1 FAD-binding oxidoreductase [Leptolyngbya sp. 7M]